MGRRSSRHALGVWMNGMRVGTWSVSGQGVHAFHYAAEWRSSRFVRPISLSLPVEQDHRGPVVERYFDNLLPDNNQIRSRLQQKFTTPSAAAFDLLAQLGRDCVGALQLLPEEEAPMQHTCITATQLNAGQISNFLDSVLTSGRHQALDDFRISVAGAQEKTALLHWEGKWMLPTGSTPTTHLLKLPIGKHSNLHIDLSTSVDNEWICSRILNAFDIPVAEAHPQSFGKHRVLVVTRFDRRISPQGPWLMRRPQEDLCQVFGLDADAKYEENGGPGIEKAMQFLLGSEDYAQDRHTFLKAQILFWMLAAIDGHAKNFSIHIAQEGRFTLMPLYDVLSAHPHLRQGSQSGIGGTSLEAKKIRMAMAWSGKNRHYRWAEIEPRHFISTARLCGMPTEEVRAMLESIVAATPGVIETVQRETTSADKEVRERILKGLDQSAAKIGRFLKS